MQTEADYVEQISEQAKRIWAANPRYDILIFYVTPEGKYDTTHVCWGTVGDPADNADDDIAQTASDLAELNATILHFDGVPTYGDYGYFHNPQTELAAKYLESVITELHHNTTPEQFVTALIQAAAKLLRNF